MGKKFNRKARWQTVSDYISIKDDRLWQILFDEACVEGKQEERIQKELEKIALDEKEIIRKAFERVVERLEERRSINDCRKCRHFTKNGDECNEDCTDALVDDLIEIVKEEGGIE